MTERIPIRRALISVSDKTGLDRLGPALADAGVQVVASGGTRKALIELGVAAIAVSELTGSPEMLDGRVKTLHPKIHGALLADTDNPDHVRDLEAGGIMPIDLLVANLYPFAETVASGKGEHEIIENIDIGGPAMIRAAAKNHGRVAVVTDPSDYGFIIDSLKQGGTTRADRRRLATGAFAHTGRYDALIHAWLTGEGMGEHLLIALDRVKGLRYGENPHQQAALYRQAGADGWVFDARQLQGKDLSFNNYADAESTWRLANRIGHPGCVVVKHLNPCGVAQRSSVHEAFVAARDCDPLSAFGGVVAVNEALDADTASEMAKMFLEVIICPAITDDAAAILAKKKNLRVLIARPPEQPVLDVRMIGGGALVQEADRQEIGEWTTVSEAKPTSEQITQLQLAWTVGAHCKSNSIVIVQDRAAVGIGVGDQSRVGAAKRAVDQAGDRLEGAVAASEALIPFRDGLDTLADAGVVALVETGGSVNDQEVIDAADEHRMVLMFTGRRHFRH
ncbi:MAG: bifunctional phosphoribosylaminoimidazolecarboxamide formyltransferase/IMP cyclohydrolase [Gammaproteobacteria bacterium]|nr:bifunctional phosphoribosylaminoimidazolecarboxamide formyltransferase/IMP cyclohydrolase [Gammaproteobacteria bacterium]